MAQQESQEIWNEITRWQRETGYSLETFYRRRSFEAFDDLSEEQKERGVELWDRYQAAGGGFGSDV